MATAIKANYEVISGLNAGDVLKNANGKRTATVVKASTRKHRYGYTVEIIDATVGAYHEFLTWNQITNRFPIKVENSRYEVKLTDLTETELEAVKALLAGRNFTTTKLN